jgi:hypothetical protein
MRGGVGGTGWEGGRKYGVEEARDRHTPGNREGGRKKEVVARYRLTE